MTAAPASPPPRQLADAAWLKRAGTRAIFAALAAKGFEARAVGGAVRDALLGRPVSDVDIATPARPEEVIAAARAAGLKAIPTGLQHGTVTVLADGHAYEITTLREDVESYGRHAKVAFTADWDADARRRDFTLNALYCGADGALFDPLGGWPDLAQRRIRFIGSPGERIREDYLRILRFFRFAAEYGEGLPDRDGLEAAVAGRAGLILLSAERVRQELLRLIAAPRGPQMVRLMLDYGLITLALGQAPRPLLLERVARLEAALGLGPDPLLRLAALAVETREDAEQLRARLRLSNEEHAALAQVETGKAAFAAAMPAAKARAARYRLGPASYHWLLMLDWARSGDAPEDRDWRRLMALGAEWQPPALAVSGEDVMALGVPAGPGVGTLLRALEAWWIADDFRAERGALLAKLRELSAGEQQPT
jgi:poly(A) polymerase